MAAPRVVWASDDSASATVQVKQKSCWCKKSGKLCYYDSKGHLVAGRSKKISGKYYVFSNNGFLLVGKSCRAVKLKSGRYVVNAKGKPAGKGWIVCSGKLYYTDAAGRCKVSKKIDGIKLKADGAAANSDASKLKMAVMERISRITKPGWSKIQKLKACWKYVLRVYNTRYVKDKETLPGKNYGKRGWIQKCALVLLTKNKTCCFGFASAFTALARELGYKPVVHSHNYRHAYVMISGKSFDDIRRYGQKFGGRQHKLPRESTWKLADWGTTKAIRRWK